MEYKETMQGTRQWPMKTRPEMLPTELRLSRPGGSGGGGGGGKAEEKGQAQNSGTVAGTRCYSCVCLKH